MAPDVLLKLREALAGRYDIQREPGGGGMSLVFVATETALARDVVVKVISPEVIGDAGADRFAREVKLAARLQHAHIVPVLTAGDANGMAYYTIPMARGEAAISTGCESIVTNDRLMPAPDGVRVLQLSEIV